MTELEILELNIANAALGVATLVCVLVVAWATGAEVVERVRARWAASLPQDDHLFAVPGLGLTMADGGEKVDDEQNEPNQQ
jgi:hypothetical protein